MGKHALSACITPAAKAANGSVAPERPARVSIILNSGG